MNPRKLAISAALLALGSVSSQAAQPYISNWWSAGFFTTAGFYPMGYHVYAHDNDGDLLQLRVDAHWEYYNFWTTDYGYGNGFDKEIHQWGESVDGYSAAVVYLTDTVGTYRTDIELVF